MVLRRLREKKEKKEEESKVEWDYFVWPTGWEDHEVKRNKKNNLDLKRLIQFKRCQHFQILCV
jgi:hypothetical protein